MGGVLLTARWPLLAIAALSSASWAAPCPDRDEALDALERAVVSIDLRAIPDLLADGVDAFACGPVATPAELARYWTSEGAYLTLDRDPDGAEEAFQAARQVAPEIWPEPLGDGLKQGWRDAPAPVGSGQLKIDPEPGWWTVWIDGQPADALPAPVSSGLHLVQVGPAADDVAVAKMVFVRSGAIAVVAHEAEEGPRPAPVDAQPPPPPKPAPPRWSSSTGMGGSFAFGRAERDEPAAKLSLPLEIGVIHRRGGLWLRPSVHTAPLIGGRWAFEDDRAAASVPFAMGAALAVGGSTDQADVGGWLGYQWPGRLLIRAVAAFPLGESPLTFEPRIGVNAGVGMEPAVDLTIAYRPVLWK